MKQSRLNLLADRYSIQKPLQAGGMTTVYLARDLETDALVAIKRFDRDQHLPQIEREAFSREVDALQNLSHPNIVKLLGSGEDPNGQFYLVLELMKHDLLMECQKGSQAFQGWDDFAELVILPLLAALSFAHENGIAHRDVKPANILVSADGVVKLADFGISKLKRTLQPRITLSNFMSPPFSPPEPDNGNHTYARDVYSIGVLCLWAFTKSLREFKDIHTALVDFDRPEIVEILTKATSLDPARRHQSAALLYAELNSIQSRRQSQWVVVNRTHCSLGITTLAMDVAKDELSTDDPSEIGRFLTEDMNCDSSIQRFIENFNSINERIRPDHYIVLGSTYRYHIALSNRGFDSFALINIIRSEPHFLQQDRENAAPSPIQFDIDARIGSISSNEAATIINNALEAFEAKRREQDRLNRDAALFDTWLRVLDAKLEYERSVCRPVPFIGFRIDGALVYLATKSDFEGVEIGQPRVICTDDGKFIRGDVWDICEGELVLNCSGAPLHEIPINGEARLDQFASKIAADRQRKAIDSIRAGVCARSALKGFILNPDTVALPRCDLDLSARVKEMLDVPKCMAVLSALTSDDLILIEGPPGTGKTQFIVGLIAEELRKNPKSRILLASQTHIAIDNALERLAKWDSNIPMVRIARELSQSVAQSSTQYLLGFQMQAWRKEVVKRSAEGLEEWAKKMGIDATEVKTGTILRQMAATRRRIADTRKKIQEAEARKNSLSQSQKKSGETEFDAESEELLEGLQELRDSHDADKKQYESLQGDLKAYHKEAEHLISQTDSEQDEWAAAFLGDTPVQRKAQRLVELQSQWADRFGSSKGFVRPLIERSAVVAATCVGLSSVEEAAEIQFDLCIIDEASKATAMECSVPMARSRRWVLVGDSKQLPPFQEEILSRGSLREEYGLQSAEADESLFDRMRRMLPDKSKVMLSIQYRMVLPIGRMVSDCFYDGKIESDRHVIDPQLCCLTGLAVNWVSTRNLTDRNEQPSGSSFVNQEESNLILNLLQALDIHLAKVECPNSYSVLVLSGYTAQVQYLDRGVRQIRHKLKRLSVECCTIDRVQGREADAVFFSVTRSNPDRSAGFLKSLERINVALSRAKDLIFIVGDDKFVSEAKNAGPLQKVLMHIEKWPNECRLNVRKSRHSQIREDEHVH